MNSANVYKILRAPDWAEARRAGAIEGSPLDRADGFIHLSSGAQTAETLALHFAGEEGLVLVAFDGDRLGAALKWELSRGGDLFPHYFGALSLADALWSAPLSLGADGAHILPDDMT